MGYDLHITRAKSWADNSRHYILSEEWLAYIEKDPELALSLDRGPFIAKWNGKSEYPDPWLNWSDGNISAKNPDEALIDKMVAIANELQAAVQGDDGEIYLGGRVAPIYPKPSASDRLRNWFRALRPPPRIKSIDPPFKVGDRVLDVFHKRGTVIEIDSQSNHGLGKVRVRYDNGREAAFMLVGSPLRTAPQSDGNE